MSLAAPDGVLVCYVPGMDLRRVEAGALPRVAGLMADYPHARFRAQLTVDHVATLLSGANPHEHGMWGPRLRAGRGTPSWRERIIDRLPDIATTTAQCIRHALAGPVDLATMPPRRRRRFEWRRYNLKHDGTRRETRPINGVATIMTTVGAGQSRLLFHDDYRRLDELLHEVGNGGFLLEVIDVQCLDHLQHWRDIDGPAMEPYVRGVDAFVASLHAKCRRNDVAFILMSDHGMEPVSRTIDLAREIGSLDVPADGYDLFVENTKATFWFHDEAASSRIAAFLHSLPYGSLVPREALAAYGLHFPDRSYGDAFFCAHPGCAFFPNDFHHPLASAALALTDWQQRPRLKKPWHQADHGYLPGNASEIGFVLLADEGYEAIADWIAPIDIAPSVLALLDRPSPATMKGRSAFRRMPAAPPTASA